MTSYGVGTRSYNRSPEKREMDRQRKKATEERMPTTVVMPLVCNCLSFALPHDVTMHRYLRRDSDWRLIYGSTAHTHHR